MNKIKKMQDHYVIPPTGEDQQIVHFLTLLFQADSYLHQCVVTLKYQVTTVSFLRSQNGKNPFYPTSNFFEIPIVSFSSF